MALVLDAHKMIFGYLSSVERPVAGRVSKEWQAAFLETEPVVAVRRDGTRAVGCVHVRDRSFRYNMFWHNVDNVARDCLYRLLETLETYNVTVRTFKLMLE